MKFTTNPGSMPNVVIQAWQDIWKMSSSDFSGERSYIADFEIYDEKDSDSKNAVVDIYIGLNKLLDTCCINHMNPLLIPRLKLLMWI